MSVYKQNKLIKIAQEFDKDGDTYNINGINLEEAIFFYREPTLMYEVIPKGSYNVVVEDSNTNLVITDQTILSNMEKIQIGYLFATMSSPYEVDFNVDVNILKNEYNKLVEDMKNLYSYVNTNMIVADGQDVTLILPKISNGEVWVSGEAGYYGLNVGDITKNIGEFWIEFDNRTDIVIANIVAKGDEQVGNVSLEGSNQVQNVIYEGNTQMDNVRDVSGDAYLLAERQWKMYSIVTGSNRYLAGNILDKRSELLFDRVADGMKLEDRNTSELRREYNGGKLEDRGEEYNG